MPLRLLPPTGEDYLRTVRSALHAYVDEKVATASSQTARMWSAARPSICGGKLVRPAILLLAAQALAADAPPLQESATRKRESDLTALAVALELVHAGFLMHDDVIDRDTLRRGEPNLLGRASQVADLDLSADSAARLGSTLGILAGDLLLSDAHLAIGRLDLSQDTRIALTQVLADALSQSVTGELCDVLYSLPERDPDLAEVLAMTVHKTGVYTFHLPFSLALAYQGLPAPAVLGDLTHQLGLAFQLQDDLLGVFGDPDLVGKDSASDLREGKVTALIAYARPTPQWPAIAGAVGDPDLTPPRAAAAIALLEESGARAAVERDIARALQTARDLASTLPGVGAPALGGMVEDLVDVIEDRQS
ncbi:polyprenyl synthetase family protein [Serinibacter salmoneus]|uniref:Geranylgeranyl diphosphate synthase type II n=1 Tax=Serinibacter salmoneus TaxID=556530 RepID=A0A2A9D3Y6_9MICO|nr:polyprenyl synthetase family protein [Serinibacter salmoneus]PFG21101.1 geranylgeranyl diphosphate synthase type II [Serinibacter salmoneus]